MDKSLRGKCGIVTGAASGIGKAAAEALTKEENVVGRCHAVNYSTFMLWRKRRENSGAEHAYAHAMLVAADNALVAIRMAWA